MSTLLCNVSLCIHFYGVYNKQIILLVQAEVIKKLTDLLINGTYPITFSCEATGEPVPTISWYFNTVSINDANKYNISEFVNGSVVTSVLTILNVQSCDVGTYTCEAKNTIVRHRKSAVLTTNGE